jgi:predicted O-methyltransferase YrrM
MLRLSEKGSFDFNVSSHGVKYDAIFIDGDHGRDAVMHDTKIAKQLLNDGGIIIWHDYHDRGTVDVKDCLDELQSKGANIKHVAGTWVAFERF